MDKDKIQYAEDEVTPFRRLLIMRFPVLALGLILGLGLSFITSRFEEVLLENISVAFFLPFIVYLADAVGQQTQNIYVRDLKAGKANFKIYLIKETFIGLALGLIFSIVTAIFVTFWFKSPEMALAVSLAVFGAVVTAPLIALIVAEVLELEHKDPAVGTGPIATVIQDTVSIVIYGFIASAILLP